MMKKLTHRKKISIFIIAFLLCVAIYFYFRKSPTDFAPKDIYVEVLAVKESTIPLETAAIGTIVAKSVDITAETSGHVRKIFFTDGSNVQLNAPLVQLDDDVLKTKLASVKAQLEYYTLDLKRKESLGKRGIVAKQVVDQARSDYLQKLSALQENEVLIKKMQLRAPFAGQLSKSKVNVGDYITVGKSIVTITDTKNLRVEYAIPEKYIPYVTLGQEVKIKIAAYPNIFKGKVAYISPVINTTNRSLSLYATFPEVQQHLTAGMFVNITHLLGDEKKALMIPARSLIPILDGEQVYKVVDNKAIAVNVMLGKRVGDMVQVVDGLSVGDNIVTDGQQKVKNNTVVKIKKS